MSASFQIPTPRAEGHRLRPSSDQLCISPRCSDMGLLAGSPWIEIKHEMQKLLQGKTNFGLASVHWRSGVWEVRKDPATVVASEDQ